ncbi:class III lanthipeptide [Staphylococcus felis]|nr:class III lanthipeptide [Staphylococcus felis]
MKNILELQKIEDKTVIAQERGKRSITTVFSIFGGSTISNHC